MPAIVDYPQVVKDAVGHFANLFQNECQRRHFAEYLTGLFVAERKTILGIHDEFVKTADQSYLNRFLNKVEWDVTQMNEQRLQWLQQDENMRYSRRGSIAVDNVLIDHYGELIEDVGWFWDHADERYKIAHDYLIANYVATSGKHYPLEFRRFKKKDQLENEEAFQNHTKLFIELVDWVQERQIPGIFTFDSYFTNATILNHIYSQHDPQGEIRGYVGDLKFNRKVVWRGEEKKAEEWAQEIPPSDRKRIGTGDNQQWYFTATMKIPLVKR